MYFQKHLSLEAGRSELQVMHSEVLLISFPSKSLVVVLEKRDNFFCFEYKWYLSCLPHSINLVGTKKEQRNLYYCCILFFLASFHVADEKSVFPGVCVPGELF